MAGALGMDYLAVRLLESRDRAERAALSAVVVSAREKRKQVDREFAARMWGGDEDAG